MASVEEIAEERARFENWVKEYGVFENIPDDFFDPKGIIPELIWTEFADEDNSFVSTGYTAAKDSNRIPVISYFVSRKPWVEGPDDKYIDVYASLLLDCEDCSGIGEDSEGEECSSCDGLGGSWVEFELTTN